MLIIYPIHCSRKAIYQVGPGNSSFWGHHSCLWIAFRIMQAQQTSPIDESKTMNNVQFVLNKQMPQLCFQFIYNHVTLNFLEIFFRWGTAIYAIFILQLIYFYTCNFALWYYNEKFTFAFSQIDNSCIDEALYSLFYLCIG